MSVAFVDIGNSGLSSPLHHQQQHQQGHGEHTIDDVNDVDNDSSSGGGSDFGSEWELEQAANKDNDNNDNNAGNKSKDKGREGKGNADNTTAAEEGDIRDSNNIDNVEEHDSAKTRGYVLMLSDEPRPLLCVLDVLSLSGQYVVSRYALFFCTLRIFNLALTLRGAGCIVPFRLVSRY